MSTHTNGHGPRQGELARRLATIHTARLRAEREVQWALAGWQTAFGEYEDALPHELEGAAAVCRVRQQAHEAAGHRLTVLRHKEGELTAQVEGRAVDRMRRGGAERQKGVGV